MAWGQKGAGNFDYLASVDSELPSYIYDAGALATSQPKLAVVQARNALHAMMRDLVSRYGGPPREDGRDEDNLAELITHFYRSGVLPKAEKDLAHDIKDAGNLGAHAKPVSPELAALTHEKLTRVMDWFGGAAGLSVGNRLKALAVRVGAIAAGIIGFLVVIGSLLSRPSGHGANTGPPYPIASFPTPVSEQVHSPRLNLRSGPGSQYPSTRQAFQGDPLTGFGTATAGDGGVWEYVQLRDGSYGYVNAKLVGQPPMPEAASPPPAAVVVQSPPASAQAPALGEAIGKDCGVYDGSAAHRCRLEALSQSQRFIVPIGTRICAFVEGVNALDQGWISTNAPFNDGRVLELVNERGQDMIVTLFVVPTGTECAESAMPPLR